MLQVKSMNNVGFKSNYELKNKGTKTSFNTGVLVGLYGTHPDGPNFPIQASTKGYILTLPDNMDIIFEDHCESKGIPFKKLAKLSPVGVRRKPISSK